MDESVRGVLEDSSTSTIVRVYVLLKDHLHLHELTKRFSSIGQHEKAVEVCLSQERCPTDDRFFLACLEGKAYAPALRLLKAMYPKADRERMEQFVKGVHVGHLRGAIKNHLFLALEQEEGMDPLVMSSQAASLLNMLEHMNDAELLRDFSSQADTAGRREWVHVIQSHLLTVANRTMTQKPGSFTARMDFIQKAMEQGDWKNATDAILSLLEQHGIPADAQALVRQALSQIPRKSER